MIMIALSNKWKVVAAISVVFIMSLYGFTKIAFVFFPDSDRNMITVDVNLPLGTRIEQTVRIVEEIERFMQDSLLIGDERPEGVESWSSYVGEGPESYYLGYNPDEANSSYAHMLGEYFRCHI